MVSLTVNGESQQFDGDPNMPLLWYLRDQLGLTGSKYGCGAGLCGACTVHLGGEAVRSCMTSMADAEGKEVVTIEGLSPDGNHPVQVAWREINVPQCGFCQCRPDHAGRRPARAEASRRRTRRSSRRWPATCAGADATSGSSRRSAKLPRERNPMLQYLNEQLARAPMAPGERVLIENVSRRTFLKGTVSGVGLVVAMQFLPFRSAGAFEPYHTGGLDMPNGIVTNPLVFVSIDPDGTVTIVAHRSEMGTGARTSVPMVLADEMEADWARVKIVQAPGDEPKYGNQDTDGSRSMRHHIQPMRQMGAAVRSMLEQAAAKKWGVDVELCQAKNHEVVLLEKAGEGMAETNQRLGYGELAAAAMALPVPPFEKLTFKDEADFRYIGQGQVQIYDLHDITTGKAIYGADVKTCPGRSMR